MPPESQPPGGRLQEDLIYINGRCPQLTFTYSSIHKRDTAFLLLTPAAWLQTILQTMSEPAASEGAFRGAPDPELRMAGALRWKPSA
jgi:hypothetical protein